MKKLKINDKNLIRIKTVLVVAGSILGLGYLVEGIFELMMISTNDLMISIGPMMTFPFALVGIYRPRFGGALLIFASLFSLVADYEIYYGNIQSLILYSKYFGCPIILLGICFLILGNHIKKIKNY